MEKISEKISEIDERLKKLEGVEAKAECGSDDDKREARLKAVYDRINAVCAPVCAKKSDSVEKKETPEENLERSKATYKNLKFYIKQDQF